MAGPALNILVTFGKSVPTWRECLTSHASEWGDETSCWVVANRQFDASDPLRPFVGEVSKAEKYGDYDDAELSVFERTLGLPRFTHTIGLAAMCNQPIDHWLLCTLASAIASEHNGVIDFDILDAPYSELGMVKCCWEGDDPVNWTIIGDSKAAKDWLAHPRFHMVK